MRFSLLLSLFCGAIGLLLACPGGSQAQEKQSVLGWLPPEPLVIGRADFKTLWRGPLLQEMRTAILRGGAAYALLQLQMSPQLEEMEEIAGAVWFQEGFQPEFLIAIRSSGEIDAEKAAQTFLGKSARAQEGSQGNLWRAEHPIRLAIAGEGDLLIGSEKAILEAMARKKQPVKPGKILEGDLAIRVVKDPKLGEGWENQIPDPFRALAAANSAVVNITATPKSLNLATTLEFSNEKDAEKALGAVEAARKMGLGALEQGKAEIKKEFLREDKNLLEHGAGVLGMGGLNLLSKELEKFPATRSGASLSAKLTLENRQVAQLGPLMFFGLYGVAGFRTIGPAENLREQAMPQPPEADRHEAEQVIPVPNPFEAAQRARSVNNLKQIGLAIHNYHDANGCLPPAYVTDKEGKPLYSWRVLLLPYLEQDALYKKWNLEEAWDSPNNKPLSELVVNVFADPGKKNSKTHYRVFVGEKAGWVPGPKGWLPGKGNAEGLLKFPAFTDGLSNTFAVVETKDSVPWAAPEEIPYDGKKPLPAFGVEGRSLFAALLFDGSVRQVPKGANEKTLRLLIERGDGMPVPANIR